MIVIVDYGMGNLASIQNMLKKAGAGAFVSSDSAVIEKASKLILPGVGAFDSGIKNLSAKGLLPVLQRKVIQEKAPILGICLGMQLFTEKSEEGSLPGLGWLSAETVRFKKDSANQNLKIPHMGWNEVEPIALQGLFSGFSEKPRFYFVHSYHVVCKDPSNELAKTSYGTDFVSAVQRDNVVGVQFHPEKSHQFGLQLLKNFITQI